MGQRDADVPLSPIGVGQAQAFGGWLRDLADDVAPQSVWCSPYQRAQQTALTALQVSGRTMPICIDERLRDRELGILDRLTGPGVEARSADGGGAPASGSASSTTGRRVGSRGRTSALRVRSVLRTSTGTRTAVSGARGGHDA